MSDGVSAIRCSGCGAGLDVPAGRDRVRCAFCGMEHSVRSERRDVVEVDATRVPPGPPFRGGAGGAAGVDPRVFGLAVERAVVVAELARRSTALGCLWVFLLLSVLGMAAGRQWTSAAVWGSVALIIAWAAGGRRRRLRRRLAEIDAAIGQGGA